MLSLLPVSQPEHTNVCFWFLPIRVRNMAPGPDRDEELHTVRGTESFTVLFKTTQNNEKRKKTHVWKLTAAEKRRRDSRAACSHRHAAEHTSTPARVSLPNRDGDKHTGVAAPPRASAVYLPTVPLCILYSDWSVSIFYRDS